MSRIATSCLHYSPLLKKTCVRQVVLDKWLPLNNPVRSEWSQKVSPNEKSRVTLNSLHVGTLMLTDVQTPFLGTPFSSFAGFLFKSSLAEHLQSSSFLLRTPFTGMHYNNTSNNSNTESESERERERGGERERARERERERERGEVSDIGWTSPRQRDRRIWPCRCLASKPAALDRLWGWQN